MNAPVATVVRRPYHPNSFRWAMSAMILAGWLAAWTLPWDAIFRVRICPFYNLTGLPCPACGMTRACVFAAHGQFFKAFQVNALGPVLMTASIIALVAFGIRIYGTAPRLPIEEWVAARPWARVVAVAILMANWAVLIWRT